jgi:MFS family permease
VESASGSNQSRHQPASNHIEGKMTDIERDGTLAFERTAGGALARERTVAGPQFNRWLVPPAALAIHLCIGMAYGFSVFWLPMTRLIPTADATTCSALSFVAELTTTSCNWSVPAVTHIFEIFIAVLGISAAIWGGWLEHAGPRKAGFVSAICWGGGLVLLGGAVRLHQLWLVYLVAVFCGIGQGLGYITPVSTLIKWFPDRRGMATGFAILGYGGAAMIGAPLAVWLMGAFAQGGVSGVSQALVAVGVIYFLVMMAGAFGFRIAPAGWRPLGWTPRQADAVRVLITSANVHLNRSWRTPQFWLIWGVLCLNVTAGIAVISMASPMFQDIFGAKLLGVDSSAALTPAQRTAVAAAAAGLVGLISLFNCLGRLFWASLSDKIGRKNMYTTIFILGIALYCLLPTWGHLGLAALFVISVCIILTMYGGGFSTVPAYLADIFGAQMVGAIHGRLITAWSVAGVVGACADRRPQAVRDRSRRRAHADLRCHSLCDGVSAVLWPYLQLVCQVGARQSSYERRRAGARTRFAARGSGCGRRGPGRARQIRGRWRAGLARRRHTVLHRALYRRRESRRAVLTRSGADGYLAPAGL